MHKSAAMMMKPTSLLLPITLLTNELVVSTAFSTPLRLIPRPLRLHTTSSSNIATNKYGRDLVGGIPMSSSADEDEEEAEVPISKIDKKIEGRKKRVILGYKAMLASYIAVGAASIAKAGITFPIARVLAAFIAMPAGVSYIMISAAKNDRLGSDTYKRLNLALLLNGALGLVVVKLGGNSMLTLPFVLSVINSTKGYAYGALGWDKQSPDTSLPQDLTNIIKCMIKGFLFTVPKTGKAFVYWAATALVSSLKLLKLFEIVKYIQGNSGSAGLAPLLARFNRLMFFSLVLYTLKDAADRDRLGGTTFIQLNYIAALSMGVNYAFYTGGMPEIVGALSAAFAAFFSFTGVTSYMKNQYA